MQSGTARVSAAGARAQLRFSSSGAQCRILEYSLPEPEAGPSPRNPVFLGNGKGDGLISELASAYAAVRPDHKDTLVLEVALLHLFACAEELDQGRAGTPPVWLARARDWLHASYAKPVRLIDAARAAEVTPVHLSRAFRRYYGCSMSRYLRSLRSGHARQLLVESSVPLAQVAQECGFFDQSHFVHQFKSSYGLTPGAYRELSRCSQ